MRFVETERLLSCVHCGLCLSSCPTYLELGTEADSPRGRILLMRALEEGALEPTPEVVRHLDLCLGCRACETACPSGVQYGALIEAARPFVENTRTAGKRRLRRALGAVLTSRPLRALATAPMRLVGGAGWLETAARRTGSSILSYGAALPSTHGATLPAVLEPTGPVRGTAVLLTGCVADSLFSATNTNTARLLQRAGLRVLIPPQQGCCGALALHLGDTARATAQSAAMVDRLAGIQADWIVTNAAGCGAHVREYDHLLGTTAAHGIAQRARDALAVLDEVGLPAAPQAIARTIAVHDPCHLAHGQGVREPVRRLLAAIPGATIVPLAESDTCCGSAGTYNLTEPAMAARLAERKLGHVRASGAQIVAAANPGCLLQIRAGAIARGFDVEIAHPIDLLARAHGLA